jgi:amidase
MPAAMNGVVGIKPTVGLTSRAGVIPISDAQDTVGPIARTVADAALVLGALVGPDPRDEATATSAGRVFQDYTRFLDPEGLRGARIGVPRNGFWGFSPEADAVMEESLATLADAGAILVDPADIPSMDDLLAHGRTSPVLNVEFREHLRRYLATRVGPHPATVEQVIAENIRMADVELGFFGQEWLEAAAQAPPITDAVYRRALARGRRLAREDGIDAIMRRHRLDALVCSTNPLPWVIDRLVGDHTRELSYSTTPFAVAGYPAVTVPAGTRFGLPLGIHFGGSAWSEPRLVKLAYAFEQRRNARRPPTYPAGIS